MWYPYYRTDSIPETNLRAQTNRGEFGSVHYVIEMLNIVQLISKWHCACMAASMGESIADLSYYESMPVFRIILREKL